jgi:hypothetical protein
MDWAEILAAYPYLKPIIDTLKPVIGDAYHLLLSGLRRKADAKAKAEELLALTGAMAKAQAALPHASIELREGNWSISMPGKESAPFVLPPALAMQAQLAEQDYEALGSAVAEAAIELKDETSFPESLPNDTWVRRFIENASQARETTVQEMWGRVLAGEIKRPGSFSLRALGIVANLTPVEAHLFEQVAKQVVLCKWYGFIPALDDQYLKTKGTGLGTFHFLSDSGLTNDTPVRLNIVVANETEALFDYGKGRGIHVVQKSPPIAVWQDCWTLTSDGVQLVSLIDRDAAPENIKLLLDILLHHGLEPKVGSWTPKDGGSVTFTPGEE